MSLRIFNILLRLRLRDRLPVLAVEETMFPLLSSIAVR